jgi:hypothetical protein
MGAFNGLNNDFGWGKDIYAKNLRIIPLENFGSGASETTICY